ncbi:hypothetical protein LCGC14_1238470 [marine sediment metagenome]|uniref:Uncharacterized protein n=1 Tax=marine sediment metagenome TaxID=412755 RepID=A0A0F9L6N7_9ZZZZ
MGHIKRKCIMDSSHIYIEESSETLSLQYVDSLGYQRLVHSHWAYPIDLVKPIIWAQDGRYGFISKEQVLNIMRRQEDLAKQQKGYAKDKPLDLVFTWDDTIQLDPVAVKLMREISQ